MPLETATYTNDFVVTNPASSDGMNNADDHMRLIKAAVKNTLPGANGPITTAAGGHLSRTSGTSGAPAYTFSDEPTLGIFRESAGVMRVAGGALKGVLPVGSTHMFLVEPVGLGKAATGTGWEYLELDGSTWPNSAFPALATHLNQGGTSFTLPDAKTLGRFPRSRTATVAAGTAQANTVGPHTHPDVTKTTGTESADHTHSGTTGAMNANASHAHTIPNDVSIYTTNAGGAGGGVGGGGVFGHAGYTFNTAATNTDHAHAFTTGGRSAAHTHNVTVDTPANTGTTETRPEALSFVFCIKT